MATVNKDFKIKSGLIVEGTTATVNGFDVLTKKTADQTYIVNLIGGTATSANEANKVVKRDANGDFAAGTITADVTGDLTGNVTGTVSSLSNHDTADLAENATNKYFTDQRAIDANTGLWDTIGAAAAAQGAAATDATNKANAVASDLTDHENATVAHGATGAVVGTTNTQTLTNKTIGDTLNFTGAGAMTINSDSHIVLTPAAGSSVKWGADVLATQGYADQAETDAKAYTDARETAITTAYESYADTAEADAKSYADGIVGTVSGNLSTHEQATTGVHGVTGNIVGTTDAQTLSNKTLGSDLAAGGYKVSGLLNPSANQDAATKSYVDTAVADLINGAPELLDTLNELAQAIGDDEDFITTVTSSIGEKVAKAGDSMSGNLDFGGTSKVTSLGAPTSSTDAATKGYVDGRETAITTAYEAYADQAEVDAKAYTDTREGLITTAYEAYADQAEADAVATAESYTDGEITTALSTAQGYANTAETDANSYTDSAITTEVLNRNTAITNAVDAITTTVIEEGTNLYFTNQRAIDAVGGTIEDQIDLIDTDDIEEGATNLYFTDGRAKTSAADLLTGALLTNITITGTGTGLTITAENGVADSDTDDLDEGTTNLYFTDVRAVDALEAVVPNFTAVELNSVAKQVAATLSAPTAGIQVAHAFAKADYRSAEYLVKVAYSTHTEISKVLLTLDTSDNIAITEYGIVGTNGSASSISAGISGTDVQLLVTTANNTSTVTVVGTLVA